MKKLFSLLTVACITLTGVAQNYAGGVKIGETYPTAAAYVFGTGEQLSGQQFQTDGIISYKGFQYAVYYNLNRNVCIARRKMPVGAWEEVVLPYRNSIDDAHNVISMGICHNDGSIHMAYDHHNDPLHYTYSVKGSANDPENMPWEAATFVATTNIMDAAVPDVTYPRFISKPDGNLLFECRFHYSGYGDSYLREYDAATKKWTLIGRYVQGMDVSPDACAYINGMMYDHLGRIHTTWTWRDDFGGGSNHDFYYAYSEDHGRTWKSSAGKQVATTQLMLPVVNTVSGGCLSQKMKADIQVEAIPYYRGYINQETQAVDSKGRIHAVNSHMPDEVANDTDWNRSRTKARLHHRFRKEDGTWMKRLVTCNGNSINSYCRVSLSFDSFDNAYILANGSEVYTASPDDDYANWRLISSADKGRFLSEPLVDRTLLKEAGVLSFSYLGSDKKITILDYLVRNPHTPDGTGLLVEYFSDEACTDRINHEIITSPAMMPAIPAATKSIRWSGSFETLLGEKYNLFIASNDEYTLYVNDKKQIPATNTGNETGFIFDLVPSHKNNIVIEAKTSTHIGLSWASANTTKEFIPSTSLYPTKANGLPGSITRPPLREKVELNDALLDEKKTISGSDKDVFIVTPFNPQGPYSIEVKARIAQVEGRGMDIESVTEDGKGFRVTLNKNAINWTAPLSTPLELAKINNTTEQTYRFAVNGEKVIIYCGTEYLASQPLTTIGTIKADDTEDTNNATYGAETIGNWAGPSGTGTAKPTDYGWNASLSTIPWNTANSGSGVRYLDVTPSTNPQHKLNGVAQNARLLTIRWDGSNSSAVYYYPVTLEANTAYELSMLYELWANVAAGSPMTVGICTADKSASYETASLITGAVQELRKGQFRFTSKEAGQYYITFTSSVAGMFGIGNLSLKSYTCESHLAVGKNYNGGNADFEIFSINYQDGAFAASEKDNPLIGETLPEKETLSDTLQSEKELESTAGSKDVFSIGSQYPGDYSLEISATILSAEGRGMDVEARYLSGKGFRTSLSGNTFLWTAPFTDDNPRIATVTNQKQIIRYVVKGNEVHIYRNGKYDNTFSLQSFYKMNEAGTAEQPDLIEPTINLLSNPDFAGDAHNAAPTGWTSDATLGSPSPNSRIQEKSQTTELSAYPDGKKAFMFRFDGSGGTWYSYAINLEADTEYDYTFDLINWGGNGGKSFDVVVSGVANGSSDIIATQTVTTPVTRATGELQTIHFRTSSRKGIYYLVFKKTADFGTTAVTDLGVYAAPLQSPTCPGGQFLFGKNYTNGSAHIQIDYITVEEGAFAPVYSQGPPPDGIEEITPEEESVSVYSEGNTIYTTSLSPIKAIALFDIEGKCHLRATPDSTTYSTSVPSGKYILLLYTGGAWKYKKISL